MEHIGIVTFLKMFETHPETMKPFIGDVYTIKEVEMNEWYFFQLKGIIFSSVYNYKYQIIQCSFVGIIHFFFSFVRLELSLFQNLRYQENLKVHAIRVMGVVEQVVHRLYNEAGAAKVSSEIRQG